MSNPPFDFIQAILTYRVKAFAGCTSAALLIVGNAETAVWYEHWIDDAGNFLLEDTLQKGQMLDPKAEPGSQTLFTPEMLPRITVDLHVQIKRVVAHCKKQVANRVLQAMQMKKELVDAVVVPEKSGEQEAPPAINPAPPADTRARVPLHVELKDAESRTADPKLRNKLVAVLRYNRYFEDLKALKSSCKQYQTLALLQQEFPDLDVWAALEAADRPDIASGKFDPGRFAWSLVMRFLKLSGNDDRTLKNYRKSLKDAGLI